MRNAMALHHLANFYLEPFVLKQFAHKQLKREARGAQLNQSLFQFIP